VVTTGGIVIRQHASEIRVAGRNTQGVRLIKLGEGDSVSDVASVMAEDQEIPAEGGKPEAEPNGGGASAREKKNLKTGMNEAGSAREAASSATPKGTRKGAPRRTPPRAKHPAPGKGRTKGKK